MECCTILWSILHRYFWNFTNFLVCKMSFKEVARFWFFFHGSTSVFLRMKFRRVEFMDCVGVGMWPELCSDSLWLTFSVLRSAVSNIGPLVRASVSLDVGGYIKQYFIWHLPLCLWFPSRLSLDSQPERHAAMPPLKGFVRKVWLFIEDKLWHDSPSPSIMAFEFGPLS